MSLVIAFQLYLIVCELKEMNKLKRFELKYSEEEDD